MERSTTYGCHFIDQPLSSFILRIDPLQTSYPRKVVDPADIICWRKRFSPQTLGLLQVLFLLFLLEAYDLLAVVPSFCQPLKDRFGLFLCGRTPCAITTQDMSIWNVSRVLTLYQTSPFLACITTFCFSNFLGVRVRQ